METKGERASNGKVRPITAGSKYGYNSSFDQAVEQPVQVSAVKVGAKGALGFVAQFKKANTKIWIDLDDLSSRVSNELFNLIYNKDNILTLKALIGFKNGIPVVVAA